MPIRSRRTLPRMTGRFSGTESYRVGSAAPLAGTACFRALEDVNAHDRSRRGPAGALGESGREERGRQPVPGKGGGHVIGLRLDRVTLDRRSPLPSDVLDGGAKERDAQPASSL